MLLIRLLEIILFVCFSVNILYLLVFSIASVFGKREKREKEAVSFRRVAILVPAYKEDRVIMECVESCLRQNYPHDRYDVVVISDRMVSKIISFPPSGFHTAVAVNAKTGNIPQSIL